MLYEALAALGKVGYRRDGCRQARDWVRQPLGADCLTGITVVFRAEPAGFLRAEPRRHSPSENRSIVYRRGPSAGYDPLPVSRLTDPEKTCRRKLLPSLTALARWASEQSHPDARILTTIADAFRRDIETVVASVTATSKDAGIGPKNPGFVHVAIEDGTAVLPLWQHRIVDDYLPHTAIDAWSHKDGRPCTFDGFCAVCGEPGSTLLGNFSELTSYHHDEPSAIAGGLDPNRGARNFPICRDCGLAIARGNALALSSLKFRMGDLDYLLVPSAGNEPLIDRFLDLVPGQERQSLDVKALRRISGDEREMLDLVGRDLGDNAGIRFTLAFFRKNKDQFHLLGEVAGVLPSRIAGVFDAKSACERLLPWDRQITMDLVRDFTRAKLPSTTGSRSAKTHASGAFLQVVEAIFGGGRLPRQMLISGCIRAIRLALPLALRDPQRSGHWKWKVSEAFLYLEFLRRLGVWTNNEEVVRMSEPRPEHSAVRFVREHPEFFHQAELRVAFLTGALVEKVLFKQRERLKQSPFLKKLRGLRIDRRRLVALLPEAKAKLSQYDAGGLGVDIERALSLEWASTSPRWKTSEDELSLAFSMGLVLGGPPREKVDDDVAGDAGDDDGPADRDQDGDE